MAIDPEQLLQQYYSDYPATKGGGLWKQVCDSLICEEITQESDPALLQEIVNIEKVHPLLGGVKELKEKRLAPSKDNSKSDKHCYYLYYPGRKDTPVAVVYTAIQKVGLKNKHADYEKLPGDITSIRDANVRDDVAKPDTMIFYSVSNPLVDNKDYFPELQGIPLGDIVIQKAAEAQERRHSSIKTYSTLSPVRPTAGSDANSFEKWIQENQSRIGEADYLLKILRDNNPDGLTKHLSAEESGRVTNVLEELALQYLLTKQDPVQKFHMRNGAIIGGIRVNLNPAAGQDKVMVNYVRGVGDTKERGDAFNDNGEVQIARYIIDDITKHSGAIERLRNLTSHLKDIDNEIVAYQGGK